MINFFESTVGGLIYWINKGGWITWVLFTIQIIAAILVIERILVFRKSRMDTNEFLAKVRSLLLEENVDGAVTVCEQYGGPVAVVFKAGLLRYSQGKSKEDIDKVMENAAIHEIARLEKRLPALATIITVAPMLGFFGTVYGMVLSFEVIGRQGLDRPELVAIGISVALITTVAGLIIAMLTQPFYNYFITRVGSFTQEIQTATNFLFETFEEVKAFGKARERTAAAPGRG